MRIETRPTALLSLCQLGLYAQSGVGHGTKALFGDQLFGDSANAVRLIFDTNQCGLQTGDEFAQVARHYS